MGMTIDCISRAKAIEEADQLCLETGYDNEKVVEMLRELPSVTPQEPQTYKWCTGCKEYDQDKHCCHRWSKVIRDTVEEMKQEPKTGHWIVAKGGSYNGTRNACCSNCKDFYTNDWAYMNYCPNCGCRMVEPQESEDKE